MINPNSQYFSTSQLPLQDSTVNSLIGRRISYIQKDLIRLSDNSRLFGLLTRIHYLYFYGVRGRPQIEDCCCQDSVFAMIHLNLFNHKLYREIDNLKMFKHELQDNEEGAFTVRIPGALFFDEAMKDRVFQGHDFIIYKIIEGDSIAYMVAQSFVDEYSLKNFILENKMIYDSYEDLKIAVLDQVSSIINKNGAWTDKENQAYFNLTSVSADRLIGFSHPEENLLKYVEFGRSSNIRAEGQDMIVLGKFGENGFEFPEEWKRKRASS